MIFYLFTSGSFLPLCVLKVGSFKYNNCVLFLLYLFVITMIIREIVMEDSKDNIAIKDGGIVVGLDHKDIVKGFAFLVFFFDESS